MKTYRIKISKNGRYGQLPSTRYLIWFDGKPQIFTDRSKAEAHIKDMVSCSGYLRLPKQYRPTYEIV